MLIDSLLVAIFMGVGVLLGVWMHATNQDVIYSIVVTMLAMCTAFAFSFMVAVATRDNELDD